MIEGVFDFGKTKSGDVLTYVCGDIYLPAPVRITTLTEIFCNIGDDRLKFNRADGKPAEANQLGFVINLEYKDSPGFRLTVRRQLAGHCQLSGAGKLTTPANSAL